MSDFDSQQREIISEGLHNPSEMGEMLRFPSTAVRDAVWHKHGIHHPDPVERAMNIERFKRSEDYQRYKVYKKRFF